MAEHARWLNRGYRVGRADEEVDVVVPLKGLEAAVETHNHVSPWAALAEGDEIPELEYFIAALGADADSAGRNDVVDKAMRLVGRLERAAGISPPVPDPAALDYGRQMGQLAATTSAWRR